MLLVGVLALVAGLLVGLVVAPSIGLVVWFGAGMLIAYAGYTVHRGGTSDQSADSPVG